jgi:hypothetical protein
MIILLALGGHFVYIGQIHKIVYILKQKLLGNIRFMDGGYSYHIRSYQRCSPVDNSRLPSCELR